MIEQFFERPILNSPYAYPSRHWDLDADGLPTNRINEFRRPAKFITPVPKPKKQRTASQPQQAQMIFDEGKGLSTEEQQYDTTSMISAIRDRVDRWRQLPDPATWQVTPETARLLQHWRTHEFAGARPFFCQIEAIETAIWLAEVAPRSKNNEKILEKLQLANENANPELYRIALKLATGAGKTTVMAMLIAWQTINAVRHPGSPRFTRGFLIVTPGITIKDRLRILQPNDPESYYKTRELVPPDLLPEIDRAKIVITNYHAFKLRERLEISAGNRALLQGRGPKLQTQETEGQMLQRVMPELMGMKNVLVLNDEAHHCYREKPQTNEVADLKGEDKQEAQRNNEAARLWISGLEVVKRKLGVPVVYDLSATPFFLRGSGYDEGTLFHWVVSDFSLIDAIECGIVKLPRVPVADNVPGAEMPMFRNLWDHIGKLLPKKGRGAGQKLDPLSLPRELRTALDALYGHYEKTYNSWQEAKIRVPPVFIVVCNNTATSKLVHDYIAGFHRPTEAGQPPTYHAGRLPLFRNFDEAGQRLPRPRTLLIDSEQLESGEALDPDFRAMSADEIERFRREIVERTGNQASAQNFTDQDLLREVMNTVGKHGRLGDSIRCVVSVSMLTEGWDTNTVTHVLGVRAFGTQLLCEQVVGRALRRQSYELNEEGLFNVEYADVLGIPFDFTAQPVIPKPTVPRETVRVHAVLPERNQLEIPFPRVTGYRVELPEDRIEARFRPDSAVDLLSDMPSITHNQGIFGEGVDLTVEQAKDLRQSTIIYHLTKRLLYNSYRDANGDPKIYLFGQLKRVVKQWLDGGYLRCHGNTYPAQVLDESMIDIACERIKGGITAATASEKKPILAMIDAYNPTGTTTYINFTTSKATRWQTDPRRCQINWAICDSDWEAEFCRVAEAHPRVRAYIKNQGLGFEVPYLYGNQKHMYRPDFIVQLDDGQPDPLNLVVEIKGLRDDQDREKARTMHEYWVPGVNNLGTYGRWRFAEFTDVYEIDTEFGQLVSTYTAAAGI